MSSTATNATVLGFTQSPLLGASARSRQFTLITGNYRFVVVATNIAGTSRASARSISVTPQ